MKHLLSWSLWSSESFKWLVPLDRSHLYTRYNDVDMINKVCVYINCIWLNFINFPQVANLKKTLIDWNCVISTFVLNNVIISLFFCDKMENLITRFHCISFWRKAWPFKVKKLKFSSPKDAFDQSLVEIGLLVLENIF